jgi:ring-1,2-phenylacetyl-CoA epoxidase subunit PaaC
MRASHFQYLLRLGDDSLILGQRTSDWSGKSPTIEVDLSFANIALDLIGQATLLLNLAGKTEGAGRDGDALAFHRDVLDFHNCLLVEQPNGDFAQTMARQLIFSTWQKILYERLTDSADHDLAAIASKSVKEVAYHCDLAAEWVIRLGDGTEESHARMAKGLDWHWRFVPELFETDAVDQAEIAAGVAVDPAIFRADFDEKIKAVLQQAGLAVPATQYPLRGGRVGHHSEYLGAILAEMQFLPRAYPGAAW